jgi:hypothetical protein
MIALAGIRMTEWSYVGLGYIVCFGTLALYSVRMIMRGRKLSRSLPPEERTWQ